MPGEHRWLIPDCVPVPENQVESVDVASRFRSSAAIQLSVEYLISNCNTPTNAHVRACSNLTGAGRRGRKNVIDQQVEAAVEGTELLVHVLSKGRELERL